MKKIKYQYNIGLIVFTIILTLCIHIYSSKDRLIDLRRTWPNGIWVQAKFVVIGMYKEEGLIFNVPSEKLEEFEKQLKNEIEKSPKMENPQWDIYQLRIVTTKGRYTTAAFISEDRILFDTWMSENLKKLLCEWGYKSGK